MRKKSIKNDDYITLSSKASPQGASAAFASRQLALVVVTYKSNKKLTKISDLIRMLLKSPGEPCGVLLVEGLAAAGHGESCAIENCEIQSAPCTVRREVKIP